MTTSEKVINTLKKPKGSIISFFFRTFAHQNRNHHEGKEGIIHQPGDHPLCTRQ